jgi:hypothetical protein
MNITQMHERLRIELLRRIQRGSLSVSLLARQTGFTQAHLSNFLNQRRCLSLEGMDRILAAQRLTAADLLPIADRAGAWLNGEDGNAVPVVSHEVALFEPMIRPTAIQTLLHLPASFLQSVQNRPSKNRRKWERFVAIRVPRSDALQADPLLLPEAVALIDRHYNSFRPYRPHRQNLYAVRQDSHLALCYAEFASQRLVLRPHNNAFPVRLIEVSPDESPADLLVGRIALILTEV